MIDSHCHLDSCRAPVAEVVGRAEEAGVERLATVGMNEESIERSLQAAAEHPSVFAIVGRHPNEVVGWRDVDIEPIERAARNDRVCAIGETGLDYYRDRSPRDDQMRAFEAHIELARECQLPLVIHTREAADDTMRVLREQADGLDVVMHCFSLPEHLDECVERGWYCSFAGNVTYPKATDLQEAARAVPDELLLVETDAPYLSPQPVRGQPNEPANVVKTAEFVAELRGVSYEALNALVTANSARLFNW